MGGRIDLDDVPVLDNHCHPVEARQSTDPASWRGYFTEFPDVRMRSEEAANTSSDGVRVPELHWLGAHTARKVIGSVLGELVADGDLDAEDARLAGERILRDNAWRLYGFST